ncbi:hypothetical protein AAHE18_16G101100 [Arachis hypogaea]
MQELQSSTHASHDFQSERQPNNHTTDDAVTDSGSASATANDSKKVSRQDIELVQNLIERCLQLYMNKDEVVKTLLTRAKIDPGFTTLVNNLPMGYPVLQQPPLPAAGQPHLDSMGGSISGHVVNGVPAPSNYHPIRTNSVNGSSISEMPLSPASVASSGHFPFSATDISGMCTDAAALDTAFTSDVASSVGLQLAPDNVNGVSRSLDQIQWNFSLSDLTADLSNLGDLEALGNYPGSPFMQSDSDILLESSDQKDIGIVDEFFVTSEPQGSQSDEERA